MSITNVSKVLYDHVLDLSGFVFGSKHAHDVFKLSLGFKNCLPSLYKVINLLTNYLVVKDEAKLTQSKRSKQVKVVFLIKYDF